MDINFETAEDGGVFIYIKGIKCLCWYEDEEDYESALRCAYQYYREYINGQEIMEGRRIVGALAKKLGY